MSEEGCWGRDVGFADPFRSCRCSLPLVPRVALSLPPAPLLRRSYPKLIVIVADPFCSCRCGVVSDFCMRRAAVYSNNHHFQVS